MNGYAPAENPSSVDRLRMRQMFVSKRTILVPPCPAHSCGTFSEKLRALIQRSYTASRNYYDIWYLSKHVNNLLWSEIKQAFLEKMAFKEFEFKGINQLLNTKSENTVK